MKPRRPAPHASISIRIPPLRVPGSSSRAVVGIATSLLLLGGCKRDEPEPAPTLTVMEIEQPAAKTSSPQHGPLGNSTPVEPPLEIIPGKGIGPIRFGATFETVERHMRFPCDVRTETKCVYVKQAVEFTMKDGVVAHIQLHRRDRPAGKSADGKARYYGSFYGGMRPTIAMGLHRHVAVQDLRPADRVEAVTEPNDNGTVERHYYTGLVIEYDRIPNGNTVLGGFQILPAPEATSPLLPASEKNRQPKDAQPNAAGPKDAQPNATGPKDAQPNAAGKGTAKPQQPAKPATQPAKPAEGE